MDISIKKNSAVHLQVVIKKMQRTIDNKIGISIKKAGLTNSQFSVLDILYTKGDMKISALLDAVLTTSGNMTVIIKNMERDNLIYKNKSSSDKRVFVVGITEKGKNIYEKVLPKHREEIENLYSFLTKVEKETLIKILKKFKNIE